MVDVTDGTAGSPTMVDVTDGTAGSPTMVDVTDGTAGSPTMVDVTDGTAGSPAVSVPGMPATEEMQATWQHFFADGDDQIAFADPVAGTGGEAEQAPTALDSTNADFTTVYNAHHGIFTPTGGSLGTRGTFEIIDEQNMSTQVSVFVPLNTLTVGSDAERTVTVTSDTTYGTGDDAIMIPAGTEVSDELAAVARANADRGTVTITQEKVTDYMPAMDATPGSTVPGTPNTPTMVDVTAGSAGSPTMVDVTAGSAGSPTMVDVTDLVQGAPRRWWK